MNFFGQVVMARNLLGVVLYLVLFRVHTVEAQSICTACECTETFLVGSNVDFTLCDSLIWIRLTDKPGDFLDTTVYV